MTQAVAPHPGTRHSLAWATAVVLGAGAVVALASVQYARHAWPFRHGGAPPEPTPAAAASMGSEDARKGHEGHEGHGSAMPASTEPPKPPPPSASRSQGEGDAHAAHAMPSRAEVALDGDQIQKIGVRVVPVTHQRFGETTRAVATVAPDESRVAHVHTRVSGWIDRLDVRTTGETIRRGQVLAGIFSQELLASQSEYVNAKRMAAGAPGLAPERNVLLDAARRRLKVLGMTEGEINALDRTGQPRRLVPVLAPAAGVVLHRGVTVGTAVDPSTELFTLADLSRVWVFAELPEVAMASAEVGSAARLEFPVSGLSAIDAKVDFVYPTLSERTRTLRVRFSVANPGGKLRPGLYGTAVLATAARSVMTIPRDAVVDTGLEQHVFVEVEPGRFRPRKVVLGIRTGDEVEVKEGLDHGERVVASGVFLLDSESRLRASGAGGGHAGHGGH